MPVFSRETTHGILNLNKPQIRGEENLKSAIDLIDKNKEGGIIFGNHISLFDFLAMAWILTSEGLSDKKAIIPIKKSYYWLIKPINDFLTGYDMIAMVTPHLSQQGGSYGQQGEGTLKFLRHIKDKFVAENRLIGYFPQVKRDKGPMPVEPDNTQISTQGILRYVGNKSIILPVGLWVKGIKPEKLYMINLHKYVISFGKPITSGEMKDASRKIAREKNPEISEKELNKILLADNVAFALIRELLPPDYK